MTGEHAQWGDVYTREWDDDTDSWRIPDKTKTPGYRGSHRKPPKPSRWLEIVKEIAWRLAQ